jgi:hypothetical protein
MLNGLFELVGVIAPLLNLIFLLTRLVVDLNFIDESDVFNPICFNSLGVNLMLVKRKSLPTLLPFPVLCSNDSLFAEGN